MQTPAYQSDHDKLRRLPFLYWFSVLTASAVLCTVQAPMALFATELGLSESQIGLLGGIMPFFQVVGLAALPLIIRFGSRRISALALASRYFFLLPFFLAPYYIENTTTVFVLMLVGMIGFSLLRSISEAASIPWSQEFLPRSVRGKVSGRVALLAMPVALLLSLFIKLWLDMNVGITRFFPVFGVGILAGVIGALMLLGLRGGLPRQTGERQLSVFNGLRIAAGDKNFMTFLFASATQYLVFISMNLFILLYFRERLGIPSGQLVFLVAFVPVGGAFGSMFAGWFVDRYGTRVIRLALQTGQICVLLALPFIQPDLTGLDVIIGGVFFLFGLLFLAGIGVDNIYMLNTVPPETKESYMALHYSIDGIIGGAVTFLAGFLLIYLATHPIQVFSISVGSYETLFVIAALISLVSAISFSRLREEGAISVRDFVSQASTGHTLRALWGITRYGGRTSEERRLDLAYGFGTSGSPLASRELIDALHDPSFDVRQEAIRSLGILGAKPDVVAALASILDYNSLIELQYAALAAIGRSGAQSLGPRVAEFLLDSNPILRSRAVRTLGDLRYDGASEQVLTMLVQDSDPDCRLAAASHLGKIQAAGVMDKLTALYVEQISDHNNPMSEPRSKVVLLAISKILRVEAEFSQFWRREERDSGFAMAELAKSLHRVLPANHAGARELADIMPNPEPELVQKALQTVRTLLDAKGYDQKSDIALFMGGTDQIPNPHPALMLLQLIVLRRIFRR